jgi:inner membrane transporter RhtA
MDNREVASSHKLVPMGLIIASGISIQIGSVFGYQAMLLSNPLYVSFVRSLFAFPIIMTILLLQKQQFRSINFKLAFLIGLTITLLNTFYNLAISRISLGDVMAIQYVGVIAVSCIIARTKKEYFWVALALVGVLAITRPGSGHMEILGLLFAALTAVFFGTYVSLAKKVALLPNRMSLLSVSLLFSAIILSPSLFTTHANPLNVKVILLACLMAIFTSVITAFTEIGTLRKVSIATFGVLVGLYPVLAILVGIIFLNQKLSILEILGILLVVIAAIGSSLTKNKSLASIP